MASILLPDLGVLPDGGARLARIVDFWNPQHVPNDRRYQLRTYLETHGFTVTIDDGRNANANQRGQECGLIAVAVQNFLNRDDWHSASQAALRTYALSEDRIKWMNTDANRAEWEAAPRASVDPLRTRMLYTEEVGELLRLLSNGQLRDVPSLPFITRPESLQATDVVIGGFDDCKHLMLEAVQFAVQTDCNIVRRYIVNTGNVMSEAFHWFAVIISVALTQ